MVAVIFRSHSFRAFLVGASLIVVLGFKLLVSWESLMPLPSLFTKG